MSRITRTEDSISSCFIEEEKVHHKDLNAACREIQKLKKELEYTGALLKKANQKLRIYDKIYGLMTRMRKWNEKNLLCSFHEDLWFY